MSNDIAINIIYMPLNIQNFLYINISHVIIENNPNIKSIKIFVNMSPVPHVYIYSTNTIQSIILNGSFGGPISNMAAGLW